MMKKYTFPKEERLCSERLISSLFQGGSSFFVFPFRVTYKRIEGLSPRVQVLISVPKRRFPHAVQRNLLKRRMREAYRLQKADLCASLEKRSYGLAVSIQYVDKAITSYSLLHTRMAVVLKKLEAEQS